MRKLKRKVFVYESKAILLPCLIVFGLALAVFFIDYFDTDVYTGTAFLADMDERTSGCLYAFYGVLMIVSVYRLFATRKLYEKARVNPETVYLIRLAVIAIACIIYVTVFLLLGTARASIVRNVDMEKFVYEEYPFTFSMYGKSGLYWFFGVSVAATAGITYSFATVIANTVYSQERWWIKILYFVLLALAVCLSHALPMWFADAPTLGNNEIFSTPLPMGAISYDRYMAFWRDLDIVMTIVKPTLVLCYVSWNITNVVTLVYGILLITLGFFSHAMLSRKQNDGYLYGKKQKKEGKNLEK